MVIRDIHIVTWDTCNSMYILNKLELSILTLSIITISLIPQVYGYNSLENTELHGESATISLDIEFGRDTVKQLHTRSIIISHLDNITLTFYGDEIPLSEPELKVTSSGNHFRISSLPEGIIMYGHKDMDVGNYNINVYVGMDKGLVKFPVSTSAQLDDDKVIETEPIKEKPQYVPDLKITSSHDVRTYWKQDFNIDVQAFDGRINSDPKSSDFNGRIDGVDVKVLLSIDDEQVATLSGVTANNGEWNGGYFFEENISAPGEYVVDVIVSYLGETVSKSSSMFVIGTTTTKGGSSNQAPNANAGADDNLVHPDTLVLNGLGSGDPNGDTLTYSWSIQSGLGSLSNAGTATPTYTSAGATTAIIVLTVTDTKGESDTDTVEITVT